mgnify:CR=1 FL=1
MDVEFLDLIKTFEKTLKRIEVLDHKVTSFKEVLETLKSNLDELVEMVMLEEIVELSQNGTQKIKALNHEMNQLMSAYSSVAQLQKLSEEEANRFQKLEQGVAELKHLIQRKAPQMSSRLLVLADEIYYVDEESNLCCESNIINQTLITTGVKSIAQHQDLLFVSCEQELVVMKDKQLLVSFPIQCESFFVEGYLIYFLDHQMLKQCHLLTQEVTVIEEDVLFMMPQHDKILIKTTSGLKRLAY